MALQRNRPAAMARRVTAYSLAADVVLALVLGLLVSSLVGLVVFVIGLILTGVFYFNFRQVMRTRGLR